MPAPAVTSPTTHADRIRAAIADLNAAVAAAAREGIGVTYVVDIGLCEGKLPPRIVRAQVWQALTSA